MLVNRDAWNVASIFDFSIENRFFFIQYVGFYLLGRFAIANIKHDEQRLPPAKPQFHDSLIPATGKMRSQAVMDRILSCRNPDVDWTKYAVMKIADLINTRILTWRKRADIGCVKGEGALPFSKVLVEG